MMRRLSGFVAAAVFVAVFWSGAGRATSAGQTASAGLTADTLKALAFRSLPTNVVTGRVQDIEIDPKNPNIWYVATAFGGVWKTVNRGISFQPIFDDYPAHNMCCVVVDPKDSNIVWLGTGENASQRSAHFGYGLYKYTDAGKTWTIRGGATMPAVDRLFDEHMFVERKDGSLWVLTRTKYGIAESISTDRGVTWTDLKPSKLQHPSARFFIRRLDSGNLLLVKHGPLYEKTGRSHLTAYLSSDDGAGWQGGLLLDERSGVSYPAGQQDKDGLIRIIYDYNRTTDRLILIASFREADILTGRADSPTVRLRQLVSKASGGQEKQKSP